MGKDEIYIKLAERDVTKSHYAYQIIRKLFWVMSSFSYFIGEHHKHKKKIGNEKSNLEGDYDFFVIASAFLFSFRCLFLIKKRSKSNVALYDRERSLFIGKK